MNFIKKSSFTAIILLIAISLKAQFSISGKITNKESGELLPGANIYIEGTTLGAATNEQGVFTIEGISKGSYTLRISYFGFETATEKIDISANITDFNRQLVPTSIDLNAVVVTGTKTERSLKNTPILTEIIGKNTIESQATTYLPQVLTQNDASFEMFKDNTVNSFSLDGLGAKYILFLVDGERIAGETKGIVDLSRINPSSIERIEMVKGAASTLYGSNAIGGVVNIITKSISQPIEVNAGVKTSLFTDPATDKSRSDGYYFGDINLSNKKLSSFTDFKLNNYAPYDLSGGEGVYYMLTQEDETNFVINQKLNYRFNNQFSFVAKGSFSQLKRDYELASYPDKLSRDFSWGAKANYYASTKTKYELSYHSDHNKIYDVSDGDNELDYDNSYNNLRLLATLNPINDNTLTAGIEYINEHQSSVQNNIEEKTLYNAVAYAQDEYKATQLLSFTGGVRMEYHSIYGDHFTPQLSAMFSPSNFKIRASYGKGFRAPTVKELYTNHYEIPAYGAPYPMYLDGNEDLKPEESNYFSGSVQYTNRRIDISAIYSVNEITNLITSDSIYNVVIDYSSSTPSVSEIDYLYSNVEEARISSLNFLLKYRITDELTFSSSFKFSNPKNLTDNSDLLNVRRTSARINLDYEKTFNNYRLGINLNSSYSGKKTVSDIYGDEGAEKELDDFDLWKLTTTHTFKKRYTFTLGVENIFDVTDDEPKYFNLTSPGRSYIFGLTVNL